MRKLLLGAFVAMLVGAAAIAAYHADESDFDETAHWLFENFHTLTSNTTDDLFNGRTEQA